MELKDLTLLFYPDPRLREVAGPAPADRDLLRRASRELFTLMYRHRGRGLAATQAGLPWRLFVINTTGNPEQPEQERVFINPQVASTKPRRQSDEEGCLSVPGIWAPVERPKSVKIRFEDLDGTVNEATYDGTLARIFQHELDHLDGVLFIDRLEGKVREKIQPLLEALERKVAEGAGVPLPDNETPPHQPGTHADPDSTENTPGDRCRK